MSYRGRRPKGWITKNGRHVPISYSAGYKHGRAKIGTSVISKYPIRSLTVPKRFAHPRRTISYSMISTLNQVPLINELHTAYVLVDSIWNHWNLITHLYDEYQENGLEGIVKEIGTEYVQDALSTVQTNLIWSIVCKYVPTPFQKQGKEILTEVIDKVTSEEINFVTNYLSEQKTKEKEI